jgi:hypothetical protein
MQAKFEFDQGLMIFERVIPLELRKKRFSVSAILLL